MSGWVSFRNITSLQHTAQQQVTLLQELLIDGSLVLGGKLVGCDHAADLVDRASDTSARNESRKVTVDECLADTKRAAHPLQRKTAVTLQKLLVCLDAHLSHIVPGMRGKNRVGHQVRLLYVGESNEEGRVTTFVERVGHRS